MTKDKGMTGNRLQPFLVEKDLKTNFIPITVLKRNEVVINMHRTKCLRTKVANDMLNNKSKFNQIRTSFN